MVAQRAPMRDGSGAQAHACDLQNVVRDALDHVARLAEARRGVAAAPADVVACAEALRDRDPAVARAVVRRLRARGLSDERIQIDCLAEAARHLGRLWERDEMPFWEVTLATSRIHGLLRELRADVASGEVRASGVRYALFAPVPGEDHVLGSMMAADVFRRAGWRIDLELDIDAATLLEILERRQPPVVGLSASGERPARILSDLVARIRTVAPGACVAVGGNVVAACPAQAAASGADLLVEDVHEAMSRLAQEADVRTGR
ncbi:B12 binding domain-containing protein [Tranquillimonas alkanivorans]|uniref:B12 binding domain-containing protein n=1 Tax=Tranquillimonas alkanivorans TaxID=441119 RepID=A0A1I5NY82_9RHOB|nr:B12 binding domain-containing protein [Tranquillimonas alkanivorans]